MQSRAITYSAVLTNYNYSRHMQRAITSLLAQSHAFDEIIIIDDGSTDDSVAVIEAIIKDQPRARLVRNPKNLGVVGTLNVGMHEAKSEFIFYAAADDSYSERVIEWADTLLAHHPEVGIISGNTLLRYEATGDERLYVLPYPQVAAAYPGEYLEVIASRRAISFAGGANVFRKSAMLDAGGYLPELRWHADWLLCLIMMRRYGVGVLPETIATFNIAATQYSHGRHDWKQQGPVIQALLRVLKERYPDQYPFFRNHAILPTYDVQALWMFLGNREFRGFLTPLLAWRLLTYKPLAAAARAVPPAWRNKLRCLLRV